MKFNSLVSSTKSSGTVEQHLSPGTRPLPLKSPTSTTNNDRILRNGCESSAKCMQMSSAPVIYGRDHLWKVEPISIFPVKEAAANTQISHCNGARLIFERNLATLMSRFP